MNKTIQTDEVLTTGKAVYEKPTMQVYEMEVEAALLAGSDTRIDSYGYDNELS